jgi:5'-methylthioadenosine phosphorylase
MVQANAFAEWAEVHGNLYGTSLREIEAARDTHRGVVFDIDYQGARQLLATLPEAVTVFILPPSMEELERRLRGRADESEESMARRLRNARVEVEHYALFDYVIVNDDIERAVGQLRSIVLAERCRRHRLAPQAEQLLARTKLGLSEARMGHCLGVIGGSGLYDIDGVERVGEERIETPFGAPSDTLLRARVGDVELLFLPRHGRGHRLSPSEINYRANVAAMKMAGATHLVSISAVGSMKEHIAPGDLVVVDQYVDLTKRRISTFFESPIVGHVSFSDPVCPVMARAVGDAARAASGARVHDGGTYVCMEGPQFSTRAESLVYRSWGVSVIGMTAMPEAKLAREAELPYSTLALATDYDCWHDSHGAVSVEAVVATLGRNIAAAKRTIVALAKSLPDPATSPAHRALDGAVMTAPDAITPEARARLAFLRPFA